MSNQERRVPDHVMRAGAAAAASARLVEAVRSAASAASVADPARGQLWRVLWDDAAQLVLVLRVTTVGAAEVVPVTTDPPACDESSVVLDPDLTVLGHTATVWGGLATEIPFLVFDLLIGNVAAASVNAAEQVASGIDAENLPDGVSVGTRATPPFDAAAEVRAELSDTLMRLRHAAWAPQALKPAESLRDLLQGRPDIAELMDSLAEVLGVGLPAVMNILLGRQPVTPEQAEVVARVAGLTQQQVLSAGAPIPADLVSELDRPQWRKPLRARRKPGESEAAVRLTVAYGTLALAARQTGPGSAPSWPQRIRQYLATHPVAGRDQ